MKAGRTPTHVFLEVADIAGVKKQKHHAQDTRVSVEATHGDVSNPQFFQLPDLSFPRLYLARFSKTKSSFVGSIRSSVSGDPGAQLFCLRIFRNKESGGFTYCVKIRQGNRLA